MPDLNHIWLGQQNNYTAKSYFFFFLFFFFAFGHIFLYTNTFYISVHIAKPTKTRHTLSLINFCHSALSSLEQKIFYKTIKIFTSKQSLQCYQMEIPINIGMGIYHINKAAVMFHFDLRWVCHVGFKSRKWSLTNVDFCKFKFFSSYERNSWVLKSNL